MPRQLKIENGPGFRGFALVNGIVTGQWTETFTMDQEIPERWTSIDKDPHMFQVHLKMFGTARIPQGSKTGNRDEDEFSFIAYHYGSYDLTPKGPGPVYVWYFIGTYNVRTRKGECTEFTKKEFLRHRKLGEFLAQLF